MSHIFIDESGQFAKANGEKYFIMASFITDDPRRTEKQFRAWQHAKFPRVMRDQAEIKFSNVNIGLKLRLKTLEFISTLGVRIRYSYLHRGNIPFHYRDEHRIDGGRLYTHIVGELLEMYTPISQLEFRVFCDQRHLKGIPRRKFSQLLTERLLPVIPAKAIIQIEMLDSVSSANIQIADWLAGALSAFHNDKPHGEEYVTLLKNNFLGEGTELFAPSLTEFA